MTLTNRRNLLVGGAIASGITLSGMSGCPAPTLDPATIAAAIKTACGIAVAADVVLQIINAAAGMTASAIISLVCSSYKNAAAAQTAGGAKLAAGGTVNFVVHVCDASGSCKSVPVTATVQ